MISIETMGGDEAGSQQKPPNAHELQIIPETEAKTHILCLCHGNVLRSQWAEFLLELFDIKVTSAALGDVSKQSYQDEVPQHIMALMWDSFGFFGPLHRKKIKQVDRQMFAQATHVLVFTEPKYFVDYDFIRPDDERIQLLQTIDPFGDIGNYEAVLLEIANMVLDFLKRNLPEKVPVELQSIEKFRYFSELVSAVKTRTEVWQPDFEAFYSRHLVDYLLANGGPLRIVRKAEMWITWHGEKQDFRIHTLKEWYPTKVECAQIIRAIETADYAAAQKIFEYYSAFLGQKITALSNEIQRTTPQIDVKLTTSLRTELEALTLLKDEYDAYIRDLSDDPDQ